MTSRTTGQRPETAKPNLLNSFKRAVQNFIAHGGTDLSASLTYYATLSLFPAILAFTSLLGIFGNGRETTQALLDVAKEMGATDSVLGPVETFVSNLQETPGAGLAFAVGLLGALYSASNFVNGFSRTMNRVYGVREGRPIWKLRPWTFLLTLILMFVVILIAGALVLSGSLAEAIGSVVGLGDSAVQIWGLAKWPVVVLMVMVLVALLYWGTPNVRPKFRIVSMGSAFAIIVWAIATLGFGAYVSSDFASYGGTYGAFAGAILLLLWLWITNIVLILGAELDVELERSRELQAGVAAEERVQLPLRNASGVEKKEAKEAAQVREMRRIRIIAAAERRSGQSD
ncbi:YihY/virulence factor BrkB family protein [Ornithinimicrobium sp. Arc0846-15]|nr:YihY/virulence factor BrkB family protein [Ornithinimicrobium laminariae]